LLRLWFSLEMNVNKLPSNTLASLTLVGRPDQKVLSKRWFFVCSYSSPSVTGFWYFGVSLHLWWHPARRILKRPLSGSSRRDFSYCWNTFWSSVYKFNWIVIITIIGVNMSTQSIFLCFVYYKLMILYCIQKVHNTFIENHFKIKTEPQTHIIFPFF